MKSQITKIGAILLFSTFALLSCSGAEESAIAKKIALKLSSGVVVLPNDLSELSTCVGGGVTGPRVRMRVQLSWQGTGRLLPISFTMRINDNRLSGTYSSPLVSEVEGAESLAVLFSDSNGVKVETDYIPSSSEVTYVMTRCFLDYGTLPKPVNALTGSQELSVPMTVTMAGIVRDDDGLNDTPYTKEVRGTITYMVGSVTD